MLLPFSFIRLFYEPWMAAQRAARAPTQLPHDVEGHVILTRDEPITRALIPRLERFQHPYVLIVPDLDEALRLRDEGITIGVGNLDNPATYQSRRVDVAAWVATTHSDVLNTNVVFHARGHSNSIAILATADHVDSVDVLELAGADEVVIYPRAPFDKDQSKAVAQQFKDAVGPNGADIVYDIVGGDYSEPALRSIAWEGRFLVIGFPAGIAKMPLNLTLLKSCDIRGVFWGAFTAREPEKNAANIAELFQLWQDGKIAPLISETYPLDKAHEAIAKLESRSAIGKLVVTM